MKKFLVLLVMTSILLCGTAFAAANAVTDDFSFLAADSTLAGTPDSTVTNKELVTVVARLHSMLDGGGVSESDSYAVCAAYGTEKGLFSSDAVADETASVTRADVVCALYKAVNGKVTLEAINEVLDIADADPNADYYEAAESFTKAGIVYGFDKYGSFKPAKSVKKYELSLMISRLLNPADRVTKQYIVYSSDEPFFLIDDFLHDYGARGWYTGGSGWRIDYTGSTEVGTINKYSYVLRDYTSEDNMSTSRRFHTQADGKLVFEAVYEIDSGNTFGMCFYDVDGNEVADAGWKNGVAYIGAQTSSVKLADVKQPDLSPDVNQFNHYMAGLVRTRMILDLDGGTYEVWMGKNYIGKQALAGSNVAKLKLYTGIEEVSTVTLGNTHLYKNYKVNDLFRLENQGDAPVGYDVEGNVVVERITSNSNNIGDVNSVKMNVSAGKTTYAKRSFDKASGIVVAEAYVLLDDGSAASTLSNKAYLTLKSEGTAVLTIKSNGTNWYSGRKKLRAFTSNVWQLIRLEANTNTQKATVKINGKVVGEIAFSAKVDGFDGIEFGVEATTDDVVWFDDIKVFETFEYDDYCPEPVPLDTGDYVLNMSVCNLWRNGSHYGWDWIRPYAELEPAIGYYDEGIPEAMDWEIKYLTEHGIKNYMTCWYPISGNAPLKKPRMIDALHDGYFNAKYSDKMTFSLMFENSGYISDKQLNDFKNYVFPMWMEWYFSDPRYCRIQENGKEYIFLTIYQYLYFLDMSCTQYELLEYNENGDLYLKKDYQPSGSTPSSVVLSACKDAAALIDWMEQQIIDAGYADGLIAVFGGSTQSDAAYKTMANMGGDGIILYAWGKTAWDVETQKNLATTHMANAKNNGIEMLTLATPGFNDIGWTTLRPGYMTTDNFDTMLKWHKDRMSNTSLFSQSSWKSKFITFDTWNEYGEGHYFFPTKGEYKDLGYGGFGYLDVIAEVFGGVKRGSEAAEANNTYPTDEQQARLTRLYPNDMDHYLRRDILEKVETASQLKSLGGREFTSNTTANNTSLEASPSNFVNNSRWSFLSKDHFQYDSSRKCWYGKTTSSCGTSSPARIDFDGDTQFKNIKMDDVSYIRLRYSTSLGGSTGKVYFKNTTDTSQYDGYNEERTFRFNTYKEGDCENGKYYEYLINVKEHKLWTGTLAGIMVELSNKANDTIYIYDIEFLTEDDSTRKPQIYVDKQKYECKDYGEIRSFDRNELYITPTEEGGLYKLLHIVYSWNRNTNILTLDTPNGTTFKFTVGSNVAVVNGKDVTLNKKVELFDGAPVVPLIYILKTAGFNYAYDFTNKYLYVTVANKFELTDDITNGDAEGSDTTEFFSGASAYEVNVVTDPKDSSNKVWNVPSHNSKVWTYVRTDFNWVAGKTYTIDFDARRTGYLGDGSTHPDASTKLVFNARYADTAEGVQNGVEHHSDATDVNITNEWQHFTITYTVANTLDTTSTFAPQLSFYTNPYNDSLGVPYQLDNVVVRTEPLPFKVYNGNAEIAETEAEIKDKTSGFYSGNSSNPLTIETETGGNKYWNLKSTVTSQSWSYICQKTTFEKGVTYYYRVRVKVGADGNNANVSNVRVLLNARYYDTTKLGQSGEWYAHGYELKDKLGNVFYMSTGGAWNQAYGSFTISQGYMPNGGPNKNVAEEITFYANPVGNAGISFMIDDFEVTTDPAVYESWIK